MTRLKAYWSGSECYRHYEAIGLGVVPITQLDSYLYRHLQSGPVIYNTTEWNISNLEKVLDPEPISNRNLVFEGETLTVCTF